MKDIAKAAAADGVVAVPPDGDENKEEAAGMDISGRKERAGHADPDGAPSPDHPDRAASAASVVAMPPPLEPPFPPQSGADSFEVPRELQEARAAYRWQRQRRKQREEKQEEGDDGAVPSRNSSNNESSVGATSFVDWGPDEDIDELLDDIDD
eukprot:GHVU01225325.1.p3 GENE.GHVU01225325.1~~GHVU01225325.1.p3  ORF type:complete len:153 (+),score=50.36 GHVU01225325.1:2552-3010(+)